MKSEAGTDLTASEGVHRTDPNVRKGPAHVRERRVNSDSYYDD